MATPPFNIDETLPGNTDVVANHPANARTFRDIVEDWLRIVSDTYGRVKVQSGNTATRDALTAVEDGTFWVNTSFTPNLLQRYNGAAWVDLGPVTATETVSGILEIATQAEVNGGTATDKIITPDKLKAYAPPMDTVTLEVGADKVVIVDASDSSKWKLAAAGEAGKLIQHVEASPQASYTTSTNTIPDDDTPPLVTEGDQVLTASMTAKHASNFIDIRVDGNLATGGNGCAVVSLYKDSTLLKTCPVGTAAGVRAITSFAFSYRAVVGDTSAHTYSVRVGGLAGTSTTVHINGSSGAGGRVFGGGLRWDMSIDEIMP